MRGGSWGAIAVGAVMIPIAAGWTWPDGRTSILMCLGCKKQIPGSSKFCPNCALDLYGTPPPRLTSSSIQTLGRSFCTDCGKPLKIGARFCGACGTPIF